MNDNLFGVLSPFEDGNKLEREYARLSTSRGNKPTPDHIDHAINFSITAWHLADKVFNYPDTQRALKQKGILDWEAFMEHVHGLCPEIEICRDLSIFYKHYGTTSARVVRSATQVSQGGISEISGVPISRIAEINGVPISRIAKINGVPIRPEGRLIIRTVDGRQLDFTDIAAAVNSFWQTELRSLST